MLPNNISRKDKKKLRKCIVCAEMKNKDDLIRVVKNKENEVNIDINEKLNGRGAYICKDKNCINKAIENKTLNRNLKTKVPEEIYEKLKTI